MPKIRPFKGVIYNSEKIKDASKVVAPPYDIIPPKMQALLYRKSPYNVVRLILGKIDHIDDDNDNRYTRAETLFNAWLESRIMVRDRDAALYIYSQEYKTGGKLIRRIGFIGLMEIENEKGSRVLPHENTLLAPKVDRLNLMRRTRSNLEPIFVLYDDTSHKILKNLKKYSVAKKPFINIEFDNVRHKVWKLGDPVIVERIKAFMGPKDIFIADGHHRYEVAKSYSRELEASDVSPELKANSKYIMAYFVAGDEDMLTVLPAHRVIKDIGALKADDVKDRLSRFFSIEKASNLKALMSKLRKFSASHAFGMYIGRSFYLLRLKDPRISDHAIKAKPKAWKRLDVSILHSFLIQHVLKFHDEDDNVEYLKDASEVASAVRKGIYKIAFLLNPTKVSQVKMIAEIGERMPKKATYFYPKPLSGLVINKLG